jgi:hypothetical protein
MIFKKKNTLISNDGPLLWYFQLHVSPGNPDIFRATIQLQRRSVMKYVKLPHNMSNYPTICQITPQYVKLSYNIEINP